MSLTLLPSGCFQITLKDGSIVKGEFSAASLKKFSLMKGGTGFTETIELITNEASLSNFLQFILCATDGDYSEFDALGWIEELGGFGSDDFNSLIGHFMDKYIPKKKVTPNETLVGMT